MFRTMAVAATERSLRAAMWYNQSDYEAKPGDRHTRRRVPLSPSYTHTAKSHKSSSERRRLKHSFSLFKLISIISFSQCAQTTNTRTTTPSTYGKHTLAACVLTRGPRHCAWRRTSLSADISSSSSSLILCSLSGSSRQDGCNGQTSGRKRRKRKTGGNEALREQKITHKNETIEAI